MEQRAFPRFLSLVFFLAAVSALADGPSSPPPGAPRPSIHQVEWETHRGKPLEPSPPPRPGALAFGSPCVNRTVFGFLPYWQRAQMANFQWDLLTHVADFSVEISSTGVISNPNGLPSPGLISTCAAQDVKPVVVVTCFSSSAISSLLSPSYRATAVSNILSFMQSGGYEGVNIDFEGTPGASKAAFTAFMQDLAAAVYALDPTHHVTADGPAVDWSNAYDYDQVANATNGWMVMAYDYGWSGSPTTGPVAPLSSSAQWGAYSVAWTVNDYITWGTTPDKIILGSPYYGYDWPAVGNGAGVSTTGTATARIYSTAKTWSLGGGGYPVTNNWNASGQVPWYFYWTGSAWRQTWWEDPTSLGYKYDLVGSNNLAGVGIWALGYDGNNPELWNLLAAKFCDSATPTPTPTPGSPTATPTVTLTPTITPTRTVTPTPTPVIESFISLSYPNPANDGGLSVDLQAPWGSRVEWTAFRLSGQKVAEGRMELSQTWGTFRWDLRDGGGDILANGVYLLRLRVLGPKPRERLLKVILLR